MEHRPGKKKINSPIGDTGFGLNNGSGLRFRNGATPAFNLPHGITGDMRCGGLVCGTNLDSLGGVFRVRQGQRLPGGVYSGFEDSLWLLSCRRYGFDMGSRVILRACYRYLSNGHLF